MLRLGIEADMHHEDIGTEDEVHIIQTVNEWSRYAAAENRNALKAEIDKIDSEIKKNSRTGKLWQSGIGYRYLLHTKAVLFSGGSHKKPELAVQYATECIRFTRPDFAIEKIPSYYLATHERFLLNTLANAYAELEAPIKALEIHKMLKQNMEKGYHATTDIRLEKEYQVLLRNLIIELCETEQYEESLLVAEEGLRCAEISHNIRLYSHCIDGKAFSLIKLGRIAEGKALYKKYFLLSCALDGHMNYNFAADKDTYEKTYNEKLDLCVEW